MSIELNNWTMRIYVKDRRTKTGERLLSTYAYPNKHQGWMMEEVADLKSGLYTGDRYRLEVLKVHKV